MNVHTFYRVILSASLLAVGASISDAEDAQAYQYQPEGSASAISSQPVPNQSVPTGQSLSLPANSSATSTRTSSRPAQIDNQNFVANSERTFEQPEPTRNAQLQKANDFAPQQKPSTRLPTEVRLRKLEAQMQNQQQMNVSAQIQQLQNQIQTLRGQVQVQTFELKKLREGLNLSHQASHHPVKKVTPASSPAMQSSVTPNKPNGKADNFLKDQSGYEAAYQQIAQKHYVEAIRDLKAYLQNFPQGHYVANAHYWLGELYLIQNDQENALTEFLQVTKQFPNSNKAADAMLKIGFVYYDKGQLVQAKQQLQQVIKQFPQSAVAKLATARLQDIEQQ